MNITFSENNIIIFVKIKFFKKNINIKLLKTLKILHYYLRNQTNN